MANIRGKEENDVKKKGFALILAAALLVVGVVGGTMAWLTDKTDPVVNTFSTSDIQVELTETEEPYKMIPGYTIHKDPAAKILAGSEDCYLFVELEKSANFDDYMEFTMAEGWQELSSVPGVYYREVSSADSDQSFPVLANDTVTVRGTVTKAMMETAKTSKPTLTITAYASQLHKNASETFTPAQAWANIPQ